MQLSGKKLTTAILAGLMGATMFGGSVFAEVTDQEFNEVRQGVNSNTQRISQLESAQSAAKDYSKDIDTNTTAIANEVTPRTDADTKLDTRITNVKEYLENQTAANYVSKTDAVVQDGAVAKAGNTIGENVTNLDGALAKETAARIGADAAQDKVIQQVNQNVANGFNTLNKNIGTITNQLNQNDLAEAQTRAAADQTLQNNIDTNTDNINKNKQNIADIQKTLKDANAVASADATKAATKAANDATAAAENATTVAKGLDDRITLISNNQTVTSESDLIKKDQTIGQNVTNVDTALHKEIAARIGADAAQDKVIKQVNDNLVSSVNTINKNVADGFNVLSAVDLQEAQTRDAADQELQKNINAEADARDKADQKEAATRQAADQNLQNQINNNGTSINDLYGRYSSLKTDINKVGARSAALAGLHPLDFDPANKLNFAVASGSFKGENSVALGAFYRPNENIMFSAASTMGDSDNAYTFGLSFKIGPSSAKTKTTSPDAEELYKVVGQLQDQLAAQQKEIEQLKADKAK